MEKHYESKNKMVLSILRILFVIVLVISITYIVKGYIDGRQNKILEDKVSESIIIENSTENEYKIDFEKLKKMNDQVIGWLKVNNTQVEYPVVQAEDNNYYLKRNLNKEYNKGGWIFADYKNKFDGTDKNIIIYGHNMRNDTMFGTLKNVLKEDWYNNNENYIIDFVTENEQQKYRVFSVYQIETEDYYIKTKFENNEFAQFIETLRNRSIKDFKVDVTEDDNILTLSTCANNYRDRIVLHAKKISV